MRLEGWDSRLAAVVAAVPGRKYELGVWDCFRLACLVVEALRGEDLWPRFSGYRTKREALQYIARYGSTFEDCFDQVFGVARSSVKQAQRGDIVAIADKVGEKHLGVCLDRGISMFLTDTGLLRLRTLACICCWRI